MIETFVMKELNGIIKKASNKANALDRVTLFMSLAKKKTSINSSFSYSSVTVHLVSCFLNHLHERCLRVMYNDKALSFKELSQRGGSFQYTILIVTYS